MKDVFLIIRDLLKRSGLAWVDRDNGQLNQPPPAFPSPAAFFRISVRQIDTLTKTDQLCKGTLELSVATVMPAVELNGGAPDDAVDRSLQFYDTADSAWSVLQGYADATVQHLDRTSFADDPNKPGYSVVKMLFDFHFLQSSSEG